MFVPVAAKIQREKVSVAAPSVVKRIAVRCGWAKSPDVNLL
jgi:hypothetical protein